MSTTMYLLMASLIVVMLTIMMRPLNAENSPQRMFDFNRLNPENCDFNVTIFATKTTTCTRQRWSTDDNNTAKHSSIRCCRDGERICIGVKKAIEGCDIHDNDYVSTIQYEVNRIIQTGSDCGGGKYDNCYKEVTPIQTINGCEEYQQCNAKALIENPKTRKPKKQRKSSLTWLWILLVIVLIILLIAALTFVCCRILKADVGYKQMEENPTQSPKPPPKGSADKPKSADKLTREQSVRSSI
ncbi:uncharacterized protein LOC128958225 [Oppia nitens]|uniref:uncharacterized protein LOC128958225 n=1 Tax=Oppia nitens TaxID=1686743 RepID=UPI0023DB9A9B|nr:uncharacterized protein LOC128958225 [Oppia nitens]